MLDLADIFSSNGSEKVAQMEASINASTVARQFDKAFRTFVYSVEGVGNASITFPKDRKKEPLRIMHPFLVIQLYTPETQHLCFEVACMDYFGSRRTLSFSTCCKQPTLISLTAGKLPLRGMVRGSWANLVIDVQDVFSGLFGSFKFEMLESVTIRPTCRLRRIFAVRSAPPDTTCTPDGSVLEGEFASLPQSHDFPPQIDAVTQILTFRRCVDAPSPEAKEQRRRTKKPKKARRRPAVAGEEAAAESLDEADDLGDKENVVLSPPANRSSRLPAPTLLEQENRTLRSELIVCRERLSMLTNQLAVMNERQGVPEDQQNLQIHALLQQLKTEKATSKEYYAKLARAKAEFDEQAARLAELSRANVALKDGLHLHACRIKELEQERGWLAQQIRQRDEAFKVSLMSEQRAYEAVALAEETQRRLEAAESQNDRVAASRRLQMSEQRSGRGERDEPPIIAQPRDDSDSEDDFTKLAATHNRVKEQRGQLASLLQQEQERRIQLEEQNTLLRQGVGQSKLGESDRAADTESARPETDALVTGSSHARPDPLSQTI